MYLRVDTMDYLLDILPSQNSNISSFIIVKLVLLSQKVSLLEKNSLTDCIYSSKESMNRNMKNSNISNLIGTLQMCFQMYSQNINAHRDLQKKLKVKRRQVTGFRVCIDDIAEEQFTGYLTYTKKQW